MCLVQPNLLILIPVMIDLTVFCTSSCMEMLEVVKLVLVLSHGQVTVERGFSVNKKAEVENLKGHTLIAM